MEEILAPTVSRICHLTMYHRELQPDTSRVSARYDSRMGPPSIPSLTCTHVGMESAGGVSWFVRSHLRACCPMIHTAQRAIQSWDDPCNQYSWNRECPQIMYQSYRMKFSNVDRFHPILKLPQNTTRSAA
jgi:hypothetical protein